MPYDGRRCFRDATALKAEEKGRMKMAFFEGIGKKLTQTSQDVMKKTKNFADTTKISAMISDEERGIQELYRKLGKSYYELHRETPEEDLSALVGEIAEKEDKIRQCREQIAQINGVKKCPECGAEVAENAVFCNSCGAKLPLKPVEEPEVYYVVCSSCGENVPEGQKFCIHCGSAMTAVPGKSCPQCGKQLPAEAGFCTECGAKL